MADSSLGRNFKTFESTYQGPTGGIPLGMDAFDVPDSYNKHYDLEFMSMYAVPNRQ
jgi:hypothetical protein